MKATTKNILVLLITLSFYGFSNGQDKIGISILHDGKLGLGIDTKYGNDKPTIDFLAIASLQGKQYKDYYFSLNPLFEYADLHGGKFYRYGVNAMWNFNNLVVDKATISAGVGAHMINRERQYAKATWSTSFDLSYEIIKHLSLVVHNEWIERVDLPKKKVRYNLSLGLKYN